MFSGPRSGAVCLGSWRVGSNMWRARGTFTGRCYDSCCRIYRIYVKCSCFQSCSARPLQSSFPRRIKEHVVKCYGGDKENFIFYLNIISQDWWDEENGELYPAPWLVCGASHPLSVLVVFWIPQHGLLSFLKLYDGVTEWLQFFHHSVKRNFFNINYANGNSSISFSQMQRYLLSRFNNAICDPGSFSSIIPILLVCSSSFLGHRPSSPKSNLLF